MEENIHNIEEMRVGDTVYKTRLNKMYKERKAYEAPDSRKIHSIIPGTIAEVEVKVGKKVAKGDPLLYLDAMKMKNHVLAPFDAVVKAVYVKEGQVVPKNFLMIELER